MKIEITSTDFSWLLRGFIHSFNHTSGGYKHVAFEMAQELIEAANELTLEQKKQISDDLYVIAFPKGKKAESILEERKSSLL
jgi:hypothetical protein